MIHDNDKDRLARRASAGSDSRSRPSPFITGSLDYDPEQVARAMRGDRPARDTDSLEKRVEILEEKCARLERLLSEKGFDFGDVPPVAEASS